MSPGPQVELGDVGSRVRLPAPAELDSALKQRDGVVVATAPLVLAGEVGVALGHPEPARVREIDQLVEDRPGDVEVAPLQRLLKAHRQRNTALGGGNADAESHFARAADRCRLW